jgi:hypothetical protein
MGVFASDPEARALFTLYSVRIELCDKVLGGIPKNPAVIEGWLRSKAGIADEEEVRYGMLRTLAELGVEVSERMSMADAIEASKRLANTSANGFKADAQGLYIESRQLKAMLKENISILYTGVEKVGPTRKGAKNYASERVYVAPSKLHLGRTEPDGVELIIGHLTGPDGPKSTLTHYEYVERACFECTLMVAEDGIPQKWWPRVWTLAEQNGLGACRSQGHGQFDITRWQRLGVPSQSEYEAIMHADHEQLKDRPLVSV